MAKINTRTIAALSRLFHGLPKMALNALRLKPTAENFTKELARKQSESRENWTRDFKGADLRKNKIKPKKGANKETHTISPDNPGGASLFEFGSKEIGKGARKGHGEFKAKPAWKPTIRKFTRKASLFSRQSLRRLDRKVQLRVNAL